MILADTTIWIDHFRSENRAMGDQLNSRNIVMHPIIVGELALGPLRDRAKTLAWLDLLPHVRMAQLSEVRQMIESRRLYSQGIGLADAHLIASVLIDPPTMLWTKDKRLSSVAAALNIQAALP
jgi:hypothetical protein